MATDLTTLITAETITQIRNRLIAKLQAKDLPTTDWGSGTPERTMYEMSADVLFDLFSELLPQIVRGGLVELATGDWLSLLGEQNYQLTRNAAVTTEGTIRLTSAAGSGPYTITAYQLWATDSTGKRFNNTAGGVLGAGPATLDLAWRGESTGTAYNVAAGTITTLVTPLPGVTVNNPAGAVTTAVLNGTSTGTFTPTAANDGSYTVEITTTGDLGVGVFKISNDGGDTYYASGVTIPGGGSYGPGGDANNVAITFANGSGTPNSFIVGDVYTFSAPGTWITTSGTDAETDAAYVTRLKSRWPDLGDVPTNGVYDLWARNASAQVAQDKVSATPASSAAVAVTVAGSNGTLAAAVITTIQDYIDARKPITDLPTVANAGTTAITLAGATVTVDAASRGAAQAAAQSNLQAYFARVGIGGTVYYSQIIEELMTPAGVVSVNGLTVNGGAVDIALGATNIATWNQAIAAAVTWTNA